MRPIRVDLAGLDDFGTTLAGIKDRLDGTRDMLAGYDGVFGHDDVSGALGDFESGWSDGRRRIEGNSQRLVDISRDAVEGYDDGDQEMLRTLTEGTTEQDVRTYE